VSRLIGEALPNDAGQRAFRALRIIYVEADAIAIADVKFREVAVKVLLLAVLVNAFHAALENRVIAFNSVSVDFHAAFVISVAIFAARMVNGVMLGELASKLGIAVGLIGHDMRLAGQILANDRNDFFFGRGVYNERAGRSAAPHKGKDGILCQAPRRTSAPSFLPI
jgi:hypothetical protein